MSAQTRPQIVRGGLGDIKKMRLLRDFPTLNFLSLTVYYHAPAIICYTAPSEQSVRYVYVVNPHCVFPHFTRPANGYRDAQLIHAGKGYAIMYSIWGRFRDILNVDLLW